MIPGSMAAAAAAGGGAAFRWVLQLHRDVPNAARFYSRGLGLTVDVCTQRWAELRSGRLNLALMHSNNSDLSMQKGYSSMLSFTVADINGSVTKLMRWEQSWMVPLNSKSTGRLPPCVTYVGSL